MCVAILYVLLHIVVEDSTDDEMMSFRLLLCSSLRCDGDGMANYVGRDTTVFKVLRYLRVVRDHGCLCEYIERKPEG